MQAMEYMALHSLLQAVPLPAAAGLAAKADDSPAPLSCRLPGSPAYGGTTHSTRCAGATN